jgi:L-alanine-DL-glutamate epimerase-like enolase superfamily enzyme
MRGRRGPREQKLEDADRNWIGGGHTPTGLRGPGRHGLRYHVPVNIARITTTPLALPFKEPYHWAGRVDHGAAVVLVQVETDAGIVGVGESTASIPAESTLSALAAVTPLFIDQPAFDIERLLSEARFLGSFNHTPWFANLVLAGLEMALWDIIGKDAGRPVYQLLGGAAHDTVDYFGFLQGDTAEELAEDAAALAAAGYGVLYMKVGRGEATDVRNVTAVREAVPGHRLRLDANGAWSVPEAIRMIRRLVCFDPDWIEQPTPPLSIAALRQVKMAVDVPIAADQSVFTLYDVYEICRQQAADAIVLSVHETGGLLALRKAAAIAEAAGIPICLHGQSVSSITDAAQHHAGLTLPNLTEGNQIMHQLLAEDLVLAPDLTPQNGSLGVPSGPGFGVELDRDAVARAADLYRRDDRYGGTRYAVGAPAGPAPRWSAAGASRPPPPLSAGCPPPSARAACRRRPAGGRA